MKAMNGDRLRIAFQPVIGAQEKDISFHESLIRLIDDDGKIIPAGAFMPAIEELGLSRLVDHYALRMAIHELEMFPDLSLSVNVSNLSLNNNDWLRSLVALLRDRPSVANRLVVEITESSSVKDPKKTKRIIRTLKDLGCRVALDDFGAGYTAFSQLKDLDVDIVKIDKSFIRNISEEHNHLFVQTLKALAEGIDIKTVGEGAETHAEADLLSSDGIDYIQGYVYGFPKVERVWLPENHKYRLISTECGDHHLDDSAQKEIMEDILQMRSQDVA
jgi:EAL domain-containing protein (putative c-di-GMP-specific phosphodiesterase class I)